MTIGGKIGSPQGCRAATAAFSPFNGYADCKRNNGLGCQPGIDGSRVRLFSSSGV